jgi:hypothetical protein
MRCAARVDPSENTNTHMHAMECQGNRPMPGAMRSRVISLVTISPLLAFLCFSADAQVRLDFTTQPLARSFTSVGSLERLAERIADTDD